MIFLVGTNLPLVFAPENGNMLGGTQVKVYFRQLPAVAIFLMRSGHHV